MLLNSTLPPELAEKDFVQTFPSAVEFHPVTVPVIESVSVAVTFPVVLAVVEYVSEVVEIEGAATITVLKTDPEFPAPKSGAERE